MNKILIATRNKDKFKIVCELLSTSIFTKYDFYNLNDLNDKIIDKEENGNLINRSYEKAKNVFDNIKQNDFEYIIGVDDGIKIKDSIIENVKAYIKPIINGELLVNDEIVYIARAYTFFNRFGKYYSFLTEIPFKYKQISSQFEIEKNSYPLSHVLTPLNSEKVVSELDFKESNKYYLNYSKNDFIKAKEYFDDK